MKSATGFSVIERLNLRVFFLLLFLYQVLFIFQGFDLSDEGFVSTFYQQIFINPESVQYNFLFWFSGIIGGIFNFFFGDLGIWGLRLFSAVITTFSIMLVYNLLKKHLNTTYLKVGIIIVLLFINNNTKVFHYNYLSVLLYVSTVTFLFNGLEEKKVFKIFIAGGLIALDTLTRIPSAINLGLLIVVAYHGYLNRTKLKQLVLQSVSFIAGFISFFFLMLLVMKLIGHLEIFKGSLTMLVQMGSNSNEGHYGVWKLIHQFWNSYFTSLKYTVIILILLFAGGILLNFLRNKNLIRNWVTAIVKIAIAAEVVFLIWRGKIDNETLLYFFTGLSVIAGVAIIAGVSDKKMKVLTLAGCYILFAYPFGSSAGMYTSGIYAFWIIFPIALNYFLSIGLVKLPSYLLGFKSKVDTYVPITATGYAGLKKFSIIIAAGICLYFSWYYPFFDYHERTDLRYGINNKYLKLIYTTKDRASVMNDLLAESEKYIKQGDTVLAYQSFPIFHYITKTVPYMRNPMPWFYNSDIFAAELDSAINDSGSLPIVITQKRKTFGKSGAGWPDPESVVDEEWYRKNHLRDSTMNLFLRKNNYNKVWENQIFEIFKPAATTAR